MKITTKRRKYHTYVKLLVKYGMIDLLPTELRKSIPRSNLHNWRKSEFDYEGHEFISQLKKHVDLGEKLESYPKVERATKAMLAFADTYHELIADVKDVKKKVRGKKEDLVNLVDAYRQIIPVKDLVRFIGISRATYQNYKTLVVNKCHVSYFEWCVKKYPHQLLYKEILNIKKYLEDPRYEYWSKSSLYYLGLRNGDFHFCIATFYKYAQLLGFKKRHRSFKQEYQPLESHSPNHTWCADVTVFKTADGVKHYIHLLVDHYSRMIIGYQIAKSAQPKIIKQLLETAYKNVSNNQKVDFVTDAGIENVNKTVERFIVSTQNQITHKIAQKTITASNSLIESINKILKYQFLFPKLQDGDLQNGKQLAIVLDEAIFTFCYVRPQQGLKGNTPFETYNGKPTFIPNFVPSFESQKQLRIAQNHLNRCKKCVN